MAGVSLDQAQMMLDAYLAAELAVLANQSYRIGDRELTRADLADIAGERAKWSDEVKRLTAAGSGRSRTRYVVT